MPEIRSALNLGLDIRIPPEYIADENQRLRAYRQIANATDDAGRDRAEKELEDRYGPVPEPVHNLVVYSALKTLAEKIGIEAVDRRHNLLNIKFHAETRVDPARLMNIVGKTRGAQFTPAGVLLLPLEGKPQPGISYASSRRNSRNCASRALTAPQALLKYEDQLCFVGL